MGNQKRTIRNKRKIGVSKFQNNEVVSETNQVLVSKGLSRDLKFTIISIFIVIIALISTSFAVFSSVQKSEKYNTITIGTLKVDFTDTEDGMGNIINLNGAYPTSDTDGLNNEPYTFKITNSGTLSSKYTIKILDDEDMINEDNCRDNLLDKSKIRVSVNGNTPFTLSEKELDGYIIESNLLYPSKSNEYSIRIWIDENAGNEVLGKHYHGKIVIEGQNTSMNKNIKAVYDYEEDDETTKCITGEEATCQETKCYQNKETGSCPIGTIIKYAVNDSEEKYFHVLHDNGENLTLQQRENTLTENVAWCDYSGGSETPEPTEGPMTVLPLLESATSGWSNVNDQTYIMGITNFNNTNAFTDCYNANCTSNGYELPKRTAKARMITFQEAMATGCQNSTSESCPNFMFNYLASTKYWTMTTAGFNVFVISDNGSIDNAVFYSSSASSRAVIEINK